MQYRRIGVAVRLLMVWLMSGRLAARLVALLIPTMVAVRVSTVPR